MQPSFLYHVNDCVLVIGKQTVGKVHALVSRVLSFWLTLLRLERNARERVRRETRTVLSEISTKSQLLLNLKRNTKQNVKEKGPVFRLGLVFCGSPTRARTWDLRINSPSLYQLSYQGTEAGLYVCC